jgi:nitrous oxide reductase
VTYKSILEEIRNYQSLSAIFIDRDRILRSLGIDLENSQFINLSNTGIEELNDLIMKSLSWMERLNEVLATAKKISMDLSLESDKVFNEAIREANLSSEGSRKVSDVKAIAKTSEIYIAYQKKLNLISSYVDYLERLVKNLDKIHYAVKGRLDSLRGVELKHYSH